MIPKTYFGLGEAVGYYIIAKNYNLTIYGKKPCWFHRTMMKLCFGIEWMDAE